MIRTEITDEEGALIRTLGVDFSVILGGALHRITDFKEKYPWLSAIDPYGDTTINSLQLEPLINELRLLEDDLINLDVVKEPFRTNYPGHFTEEIVLESLKSLISELKLDTHQYLKFTGD